MAKKATKKTAAKKTVAKKAPAKKAAKKVAKKSPAKKAVKKVAKKSSVKKAVKKVAAKKTAPKKIAAKKSSPKKASKKSAPAAPKTNVINPYLTFNGNCEEAFNFYRAVFGGNFTYVGRFNEMPPMEGQPSVSAEVGNLIMHISLPISTETILMGSDSSEEFGKVTTVGNNFGISINATSEKEADRLYNALSEGGKQTMPMSKTFWGSYWGMLTDRFDINWMISFGQ
ncbi:MAG: VOC family protein [Bacteroidota bacterium]